jgi:hypothetical protein
MVAAAVNATLIESGTASASASVSATAGNALLVGGGMFNSGAWSVTRTGDTFTTDANGANSTEGAGIASAPNVTGGAVSCSITCSGGSGVSGWAFEVSGLPTSAILDATSPALAQATSTTPTSSALTNTTADAIYVCSFGKGGGVQTGSPTGSWSNTPGGATMFEGNGASFEVGGLEYQIVSSTASRTGTWTTSTSNHWTAQIAVYKAAAGAAAAWPPLLLTPTRIMFVR